MHESETIWPADQEREKLRDQFAMAALAGPLSSGDMVAAMNKIDQHKVAENTAIAAYEYADAMMIEREKEGD